MIVDMGRTCFTQLMQFDLDGNYIVPVRFYFAPPGAKVFPGAHLFGTDYFLSHVDCDIGPGLYWNDTRVYDKGAPPPGITGLGPPCGPLDWWQNGVPSDAPPLEVDAQGRSICCGASNLFQDTLGIANGAQNTVCQPWHVFVPPTRSLRDLTAGVNWVPTINTTLQYFAHDPAATTHTMNCTSQVVNCFGFNRTNPLGLIPTTGHIPVPLILLSWNPVNAAGYWQVPSTGLTYAGHIFKFVNPT